MNRVLILGFFIFSISAYGQSENSSQPDSIYKNRRVRKIIRFENSPRDLAEITHLDIDGRKIRSITYSASYNGKTRKNKRIERTKHYRYDSKKKLIQIIDSIAHFDNSFGVDYTLFFYDSLGRLTESQDFKEKFPNSPNYETLYFYEPFKSITTQRRDSLIVYHMTSEFEHDFYRKRWYGYTWEPKLKEGLMVVGQDTSKVQYSDYKDLQKFNSNTVLANTYNSKGQIISSDFNQVFMNDRTITHKLTYYYYPNGLLKSVRGYIPDFFEYEYEK
jgi:hypothetical protein